MRATGVPLVGRDEELDLLRRRLQEVASGRSGASVVLVEGSAGIGKTRLVTEALAGPGTAALEVRWGGAEELARARPFWPVAEALGCRPAAEDPQLRAVGELLLAEVSDRASPLERIAVPEQRFAALEALLGVIEELAARAPLALVLDDLQWADPSTLLALRVIGRRLRSLPIAVL
ncbi:MAG: ATP-binding protein, partial [Acidimicrobiia bacterium]|nr:ATP-binding protein [Acidimicrobiia bacterium]